MDFEFKCKNCGQSLVIDEEQAGKEGKCPKCATAFTIPTAEEVKAGAGVPSPESGKNCPACGASVKPEARFCDSCGTEIAKGAVPLQKKASGFATASLILGILGFCTTITSIPGLILGIVGLQRIKRSGGMLTGQGVAIAGIVVSAVVLVLLPIQAAMLLPALSRAREQARRAVCMSNLKQVGLGCHMWALDHDDQFPPSLKDPHPDYVSLNVFVCPSTEDEVTGAEEIDEKGSYIYVSGLNADSPADAVLLYDRKENHNGEGRNVLFVDGHVEWMSEEEFRKKGTGSFL